MWVRFTQFDQWIEPDRRAFMYQAGECFDLPEHWACHFLARQSAVEADPPATVDVADPFVPAPLGDAPLTVACVHRSGGIYDGRDYAQRLARGVARHLTTPYRFVCLTDLPLDEPGIERIELVENWPKFWSKIELYRPGLFHGPVLYFDLDTVIAGDLGELAALTDPVVAAWDLQHGWLNSSLLRFNADLSFVHAALKADFAGVRQKYESGGLWGDQGLLQDSLRERRVGWKWAQSLLPEQIIWMAGGMRSGPPPAGTRVTMWYGNPKPHEIGDGSNWLSDNWK